MCGVSSWSSHTYKCCAVGLVLFCFCYFVPCSADRYHQFPLGPVKIVGAAANSRARSCMCLRRLLCASTYYPVSCACLIAMSHDMITNTSITVSILILPLIRMRYTVLQFPRRC
ncbi:hypothetical protein BGY98DRAFT_984872 [Russula aff. rugulosa BPL654]|nr:hypothetical protein BGY98DRAFT_984872 [Russula aff. rugulosa BPL654]